MQRADGKVEEVNYREETNRTANTDFVGIKDGITNTSLGLLNAALGLSGEAGETADIIKKHIFHGVPLDRQKLLSELGDCRWYLERFCELLDVTMVEIEEMNVNKLRKRYPNGFSTADSVRRADNSEQ